MTNTSSDLFFETLSVGPFMSNCYLLGSADGDELVVIDPGAEDGRIIEAISASGRTPVRVLATHGHIDHIGAVQSIQNKYDIPFLIHESDTYLVEQVADQASMFDLPAPEQPEIDGYIETGIRRDEAGLSFEVRHTPGHSPGGITMVCEGEEFAVVGDCIFSGSIGRTDFPKADQQTLLNSIRDEIFSLPDSTVLYPGHGPETTVEREKQFNPHLKTL